jgi:hypothetical protein
MRKGRPGEGWAALDSALVHVRDRDDLASELALLCSAVDAAFTAGGSTDLDRALHEVDRASSPERLAKVRDLVRAGIALNLGKGDAPSQVALIRDVPDALRYWSAHLEMRLAVEWGREDAAEVLDRYQDDEDPEIICGVQNFRGRAAYLRGDYQTAAHFHERAAAQALRWTARAAALTNLAAAALELYDFAECVRVSTEVMLEARGNRHPVMEALAEALLRAVEYRGGGALEPDLELAEAILWIPGHPAAGFLTLTEAAICWRRDDTEEVRRLCGLACAAFRLSHQPAGVTLASALAWAVGDRARPREVLLAEAQECGFDLVSRQAELLIGGLTERGDRLPSPPARTQIKREILALSELGIDTPAHLLWSER